MSVNEAWQGRRFKTSDYRDYEAILCAMLPPMKVADGKLSLTVEFGLNPIADIDNGIKPFVDCLQKKYGFNDRYIYQLIVTKEDVKRGDGYIKFTLKPLGN